MDGKSHFKRKITNKLCYYSFMVYNCDAIVLLLVNRACVFTGADIAPISYGICQNIEDQLLRNKYSLLLNKRLIVG